jgi:SAM-dependent methyltransferase
MDTETTEGPSEFWNSFYSERERVWSGKPNPALVREVETVAPARALDLGCGEGADAIWLAERGWTVTGVDFSSVAIGKARDLPPVPGLNFVCADVLIWRAPEPVDLALLCYLQLPADQRRAVVRAAAASLAADGLLLVIAHHSRNLAEGTGGPQDPSVLYAPQDVVEDLDGTGMVVERADAVTRDVPGAARSAIDTLVRARRGAAPPPASSG